MSLIRLLLALIRSAIPRMMPSTIRVVPISQRFRKSSSMVSFRKMPRTTIGIEPMMMYQPIRESRWPRYSARNSDFTQVDPIRQMSLRK